MNIPGIHFSLVKKIALPGLILLIMIGSLSLSYFFGMRIVDKSLKSLLQASIQQTAGGNLRSSVAVLLMTVNDYVITKNETNRNEYAENLEHVRQRIEGIRSFNLTDEENFHVTRIESLVEKIDSLAQVIFHLDRVQSNPPKAVLMKEMDHQFGNRLNGEVADLYNLNAAHVTVASLEVESVRHQQTLIILIAILVGITVSVSVVFLTVTTVTKPILELVKMARRITARDFSVKLRTTSEDEIGMLIEAFNAMADEINRRYEELEQFAYIVAHDLKSPIAGIRGFSEILKTDFGEKLDDEGKEFLQIILESSDRMTVLINDLLEFARAGKVEFAKDPVPLSKMLSDVETDLSFVIKQRNARIDVKSDLPPVLCHPIRFSQVWKNLLSNSIKYNESATPSIEIGYEELKGPQPTYEFYLKDNGIGIDEKHLETMFMPFKRGTNAAKYEGTGIGLAIVKRVVELHRGRVWAESRIGEGATFRFTVPKPV